MFKTKTSIIKNAPLIDVTLQNTQKNYLIQKTDYIEVRVFTNDGEIIINPPDLTDNQQQSQSPIQNQQTQGVGGGVQGNTSFPLQYPTFLVEQDGFAKIPLIGRVKLEGLTLAQADSALGVKFSEFYVKPFVRSRYTNKRIFVFKGQGGSVLPLRNEKITLIEALAQTGGVPNDLRVRNIRLIRGDLKDPDVYLINLRTIEGMKMYDLTLEPNDIIYVEPVQKPILEALKDTTPIFGFITSILTLILLFRRN
jgi:polysaccharide biosynthesis/export protein